MFFLQQNQRTRVWNRFCLEAVWLGEGVAKTMYTHVSKCKNNKIKFKKKEKESFKKDTITSYSKVKPYTGFYTCFLKVFIY
jgi:hypothetical protein